MSSFLQDLIEQDRTSKNPIFKEQSGMPISYPVPDFPILNQQLGGIYRYNLPDGTPYEYKRLGIGAGQFIIVAGESQSGKTTSVVQMAWSIVDPFGEDASLHHFDGEKSFDWLRAQSLTKAPINRLQESYDLNQEVTSWDGVLERIKKVSAKKEADKARFMYDTGIVDIFGNNITYYKPTCIIVDSVKKFMSKKELETFEEGLLSDQMAGGREAIFRGKFFQGALEFLYKYNIMVFLIHHFNDEIKADPFAPKKPKALTFMSNGKVMNGGEKMKFFTSTIIEITPINDKTEQSTVEANGYVGLKNRFKFVKSRSGSAIGKTSDHIIIPTEGYQSYLTLVDYAAKKGLISGKSPNCRFSEDGTRFSRLHLVDEFENKPQLFKELLEAVKPELDKELEVFDYTNTDYIEKSKNKNDLMKELGLI